MWRLRIELSYKRKTHLLMSQFLEKKDEKAFMVNIILRNNKRNAYLCNWHQLYEWINNWWLVQIFSQTIENMEFNTFQSFLQNEFRLIHSYKPQKDILGRFGEISPSNSDQKIFFVNMITRPSSFKVLKIWKSEINIHIMIMTPLVEWENVNTNHWKTKPNQHI